ncbi:hypothetical protein Hypma_008703 [Hypsizygus marmoreus]|uniref:DUF7330 domain-containing protein n=1 Tax=Hypsizygus marmoreus TaxID=39966 RepID=A0A369JX28_HYPMA|nr:hypothetical protein Hypma_008703 [Hypsizygus marmoreus]
MTSFSGLPRRDRKLMKSRSSPSVRGTQITSEQLLPSLNGSKHIQRSVNLHKEVFNEDINIRVLLLPPPWPCASPPFVKSIIDLYSRFGSINTEVIRLSGAEDHFFRLYVISCEDNVKILLPNGFRGVISVESCSSRIKYSAEVSTHIRKGLIRVNTTEIADDEDEVHIHSPGKVEIRLMDEESLNRRPPVWETWYDRDNRMHRLGHWWKVLLVKKNNAWMRRNC